jgi:hypothetical protein
LKLMRQEWMIIITIYVMAEWAEHWQRDDFLLKNIKCKHNNASKHESLF